VKRMFIALLMAASVSAQAHRPVKPSPVIWKQPVWTSSDPNGVFDFPISTWESVRKSLFGKLTWKHYKVEYQQLPGRVLYCRVENLSYPLKGFDRERGFWTDFTHDPRNLVLTHTSFEFDAVAGDTILWKVWSR
jgi:hypothetical protein